MIVSLAASGTRTTPGQVSDSLRRQRCGLLIMARRGRRPRCPCSYCSQRGSVGKRGREMQNNFIQYDMQRSNGDCCIHFDWSLQPDKRQVDPMSHDRSPGVAPKCSLMWRTNTQGLGGPGRRGKSSEGSYPFKDESGSVIHVEAGSFRVYYRC